MATRQYHNDLDHNRHFVDNDPGVSPSFFNSENIIFPPSLAQSPKEISREARKAKRALRRRIKPGQNRCGDRMKGPGPLFEQQSRGVPRLPRGGDGLADVSLRPSLPLQHSFGTYKLGPSSMGQPQRPATFASHRFRAETSRFVENRPRSRSVSAPPVISGAGREDCRTSQRCETCSSFGAVVHDHEQTLSLLPVSPDTKDGFKNPLPPSKDSKRRGQFFSEGRRRLIPDASLGDDDEILQKHQQQYGIVTDGDNIDGDSFPRDAQEPDDAILLARYQDDVGAMSDDAAIFVPPCQLPSNETSCLDESKEEDRDPTANDADYMREQTLQTLEFPLEQGREARVMLSSTVALSPRGRCKTPTWPTDKHGFQSDTYNWMYSPRRARADGSGRNGPSRPISPATPLMDYWLYSDFGRRAESEVKPPLDVFTLQVSCVLQNGIPVC